MSLAADLLKRAGVPAVPSKPKKPKTHALRPDRPEVPPGVYAAWIRNKWVFQAYISHRGAWEYVGNYGTPERAAAAVSLMKHWQRKEVEELPLKPSHKIRYNRL